MTHSLKAVMVYDGQYIPDWWESLLDKFGVAFEASKEPWSQADLVRHAQGADFLIQLSPRRVITAETIAAVDTCWAIISLSSGIDLIDVAAATKHGVVVANTPDCMTEPMADGTVSLLFSVAKQVTLLNNMVKARKWGGEMSSSFMPVADYRGATLGLVGFGRIGRAVARKLSGFGMNILAFDPYIDSYTMAAQGVRHVGLSELLRQSDFVCLTCPLSPETYHLISEQELRMMKPTAVLVNTGRGPIIDQVALYQALTEGWIARAGLDVTEVEPINPDNPLLDLDNVIITAHSVGNSSQPPEARWSEAAEVIRALVNGHWPNSVVNRRDVTPRRPLK